MEIEISIYLQLNGLANEGSAPENPNTLGIRGIHSVFPESRGIPRVSPQTRGIPRVSKLMRARVCVRVRVRVGVCVCV